MGNNPEYQHGAFYWQEFPPHIDMDRGQKLYALGSKDSPMIHLRSNLTFCGGNLCPIFASNARRAALVVSALKSNNLILSTLFKKKISLYSLYYINSTLLLYIYCVILLQYLYSKADKNITSTFVCYLQKQKCKKTYLFPRQPCSCTPLYNYIIC